MVIGFSSAIRRLPAWCRSSFFGVGASYPGAPLGSSLCKSRPIPVHLPDIAHQATRLPWEVHLASAPQGQATQPLGDGDVGEYRFGDGQALTVVHSTDGRVDLAFRRGALHRPVAVEHDIGPVPIQPLASRVQTEGVVRIVMEVSREETTPREYAYNMIFSTIAGS